MANFIGTNGDDVFNGTEDNDNAYAGNGNDTLNGNGGNDTLNGQAGDDKLFGGDGDDFLDGGEGVDLLDGGAGNDTLRIAQLADLAVGDRFTGGSGYDRLFVASNSSQFSNYDLTKVTIDTDIEEINAFGGIAIIGLAVFSQFTMMNGYFRFVESGTLTLTGNRTSNISLYLAGGDDTVSLAGNSSLNSFLLDGGAGNDRLLGGETVDLLNGGEGNDILEGNGGNDSISGRAGDDILRGGAGNDSLYDDAGDNRMEGGDGDDTFWVDLTAGFNAADVVDGGSGEDMLIIAGGSPYVQQVINFGNYQLNGIERIRASYITFLIDVTAASALTGVEAAGITFSNGGTFTARDGLFQIGQFTLNAGGNTFDGSALTASAVTVRGAGGNDVITGGTLDDRLSGSAGDDRISGGAGRDTLSGGAGVDLVDGGDGDDILIVEANETISTSDIFRGGAGRDTLQIAAANSATTIDFTLATLEGIEKLAADVLSTSTIRFTASQLSGFEGVDLTGNGTIQVTTGGTIDFTGKTFRGKITLSDVGNSLILDAADQGARIIYGGAGDDIITGGQGNHNILAGGGNDTITSRGFGSVDGGAGNDRLIDLSGYSQISGGSDDDTIVVMTAPQSSASYSGGSGNDLIDVTALGRVADISGVSIIEVERVKAADQIKISGSFFGILTNVDADELIVATAGSAILRNDSFTGSIVRLSASGNSIDLLGSTHSYNIFGGASADTVVGGNATDVLTGNAGNDVLDGGGGADTLIGGSGNDTYVVDNAGDVVTELAGEGVDIVRTALGSYTLGDNIENLTGTSIAQALTGNALANTITGGTGADTLDGGAGRDTLLGGSGNDVLTGGADADTLTGGAGADIFRDTAAGLNGDTITDFALGDRIAISDATLAGFQVSVSGNTVSYTGGSLTLAGGVRAGYRLDAAAIASGGVELTLVLAKSVQDDFNGDGRSDIVWRNDNGAFTDWLGQPSGGFALNDAAAYTMVPLAWKVAGVGDFNGDGRSDVLWRNDNGALTDWLGQANGGFAINDTNAYAQVSLDWKVAGVGDFNGDGRSDILWRNDNGALTDWLGQANGGFAINNAAYTTAPTSWKVAGVGDFNGDGRDDILWRNDNGALTDWLGQANGGFALNDAAAYTTVPTSWRVAGVGDFNGDGRDDILWRNDNGALTDWLGQANGGFAINNAAYTEAPTAWKVSGVGDYNGDGRDDILWRNDNGALTDWLGQTNGGFVFNDAAAYTVVPTAWKVADTRPLLGGTTADGGHDLADLSMMAVEHLGPGIDFIV